MKSHVFFGGADAGKRLGWLRRSILSRIVGGLWILASAPALALEIIPPDSARVATRVEVRLSEVPAASNPFDPDSIRVDGRFISPTGKELTVPGFWYRGHARRLEGDRELLSAVKTPEWRLRFMPAEPGRHTVSVTVVAGGEPAGAAGPLSFEVAAAEAPPPRQGYVRIAANDRYFETGDGRALPLIGHCVCWHGRRGTYDYDDWFYLDWVRLENVLPARYAGGWQPSPVATGLRGEREALLYVVNPRASYPANATNALIAPLTDGAVVIQGLPLGRYRAQWFDASSARPAGDTLGVSDGATLRLPLPELAEDLAGRLAPHPEFSLQAARVDGAGVFTARLAGGGEGVYGIDTSTDLLSWQQLGCVTNHPETPARVEASTIGQARRFFRARLVELVW